MAKNDLASIGDIYGKMLSKFKHDNHLTNESHNQNAFTSPLPHAKYEPLADGVKDIEDEYVQDNKVTDHTSKSEKCGCKVTAKKKTPVSKKYHDEEDEEDFFEEENQKSDKKYLNKHMSKSKFDSIVKKVLRENFGQDDTELDALGLDDATPDNEMDFGDDDMGDEGDEVSFTLPRDVAQQLVDVLQAVLGGDEDLGDEDLGDEDMDDDLDLDMGGDEGFDEDEMGLNFEEDEEGMPTQKGKGNIGKFHNPESKKAPDKKKVYQAKSNKVGAKPNVSSGDASSDVTYEISSKEGAPSMEHLKGKNNKVGGKVVPGDFFK